MSTVHAQPLSEAVARLTIAATLKHEWVFIHTGIKFKDATLSVGLGRPTP